MNFDKVSGSTNRNNNNVQGNNNSNKYQCNSNNNNTSNQVSNNNDNSKNGNQSQYDKNNGCNNNKCPEFIGSIINKTRRKNRSLEQLKNKYNATFSDTEETCTRGILCLFEHALCLSGYYEDDITLIVKFIDKHKDFV